MILFAGLPDWGQSIVCFSIHVTCDSAVVTIVHQQEIGFLMCLSQNLPSDAQLEVHVYRSEHFQWLVSYHFVLLWAIPCLSNIACYVWLR